MPKDFEGKLVLVTGAASGIGRATALAFAREGADLVVCCDRNEAGLAEAVREIESLGRKTFARRVDVSNADQMRAFAADVTRECGALDILVNNAGISVFGGLLDMSLDDWQEIVGSNLWGVIHGCHFFLPPMIERKRGHVVNLSSASAFAAFASSVAYSATKFAVQGLSEGLRAELAPHGIGVTTVCPGLVNTNVINNALYRGKHATEGMRSRLRDQAVKRGGDPAKVAAAIVNAVKANTDVALVTPDAWAAYMLKRVSPALTRFVGRKFAESIEGTNGTARSREVHD
jgi:NAD(P)-dependent dehydrogenase (short-subunit alcohol dehydrogenase family)